MRPGPVRKGQARVDRWRCRFVFLCDAELRTPMNKRAPHSKAAAEQHGIFKQGSRDPVGSTKCSRALFVDLYAFFELEMRDCIIVGHFEFSFSRSYSRPAVAEGREIKLRACMPHGRKIYSRPCQDGERGMQSNRNADQSSLVWCKSQTHPGTRLRWHTVSQ